jgi:chorismate dehydratase
MARESAQSASRAHPKYPKPLRIGSVSFLNAKPLLFRLESQRNVEVFLDVPSRLLDSLSKNLYDIALLPVIDFQQSSELQIVPVGGIGSDGPTLTVRVFSKVPVGKLQSLQIDGDSHTSIALARIILAERYQIRPEFIDGDMNQLTEPDARLLIGDKVIRQPPTDFKYELDLGEAWKKLTGLPFVFATWMTRSGNNLGNLPQQLDQARREGVKHIPQIVAEFADIHGWPTDLAHQYLSMNLEFEIGPRQIQGMQLFWDLAGRHGLISEPARKLEFYDSSNSDQIKDGL